MFIYYLVSKLNQEYELHGMHLYICYTRIVNKVQYDLERMKRQDEHSQTI